MRIVVTSTPIGIACFHARLAGCAGWGENSSGQLGDGTNFGRFYPVRAET